MPGTLECARPRRLGDLSLAVLGRLCSRWGGDLEGFIRYIIYCKVVISSIEIHILEMLPCFDIRTENLHCFVLVLCIESTFVGTQVHNIASLFLSL